MPGVQVRGATSPAPHAAASRAGALLRTVYSQLTARTGRRPEPLSPPFACCYSSLLTLPTSTSLESTFLRYDCRSVDSTPIRPISRIMNGRMESSSASGPRVPLRQAARGLESRCGRTWNGTQARPLARRSVHNVRAIRRSIASQRCAALASAPPLPLLLLGLCWGPAAPVPMFPVTQA